jgi:hypothetical protein
MVVWYVVVVGGLAVNVSEDRYHTAASRGCVESVVFVTLCEVDSTHR